MEPGSQTNAPAERNVHKLANLIGTLIALLTLAVPFFAIVHFSSTRSSANTQSWQVPANLLPRSRE